MVQITVLPPVKTAFVRDLSSSFSSAALTSHDNSQAPIDMPLAHKQHDDYVAAIRQFVPTVHTVNAATSHPDCCFIEDTCVIVGKVAVITRPGHPSRQGEVVAVKDALEHFATLEKGFQVYQMPAPCLLDGGDVLFTGTDVFVGLSKRTNREGAEFLCKIFEKEHQVAQKVYVIDLQTSASAATLHLKCVVTALTDRDLIVSDDEPGLWVQNEMERLVKEEGKVGYRFIRVPDQVAANILRFPDGLGGLKGVVVQKGFPESLEVLTKAAREVSSGCEVVELEMSQFILADGALTCCSLLLTC